MPAKRDVLGAHVVWAAARDMAPDAKSYLASYEANLFRPLSAAALEGFTRSSGNELADTGDRPAKISALHSSPESGVQRAKLADFGASEAQKPDEQDNFIMANELTPKPSDDFARQRGAREYFAHGGEYRNPYPLASADFNEYERGWMQSLKRNEGKLVSPIAPAPPRSASTPAPSDYNAYAELKGRRGPRK